MRIGTFDASGRIGFTVGNNAPMVFAARGDFIGLANSFQIADVNRELMCISVTIDGSIRKFYPEVPGVPPTCI